jgi:hypothetical protein
VASFRQLVARHARALERPFGAERVPAGRPSTVARFESLTLVTWIGSETSQAFSPPWVTTFER